MSLSVDSDFVFWLGCIRAQQRAHYLQVVPSNPEKQQPGFVCLLHLFRTPVITFLIFAESASVLLLLNAPPPVQLKSRRAQRPRPSVHQQFNFFQVLLPDCSWLSHVGLRSCCLCNFILPFCRCASRRDRGWLCAVPLKGKCFFSRQENFNIAKLRCCVAASRETRASHYQVRLQPLNGVNEHNSPLCPHHETSYQRRVKNSRQP